jgi:hypothetical protein
MKKRSEQRVRRHIISMRISAEEWRSLHETMQCLHFQRVSDLMREAFKLVLAPPPSLEAAGTNGNKRTG